MGQKSTIFRVSRFVTHIPKRKVSQNLNTLMRNYPLLAYKAFPLAIEPGFCSFCSSCPFYGETKNWTKPAFCSFCSFCWFFWGTFSPFKNSIFKAENEQNPGFVHFFLFVDLMGGPKMNKTRVLFIMFILFILLGNMFPFKNSIFSIKWLKPGFCSFCSFCWFDGGPKMKKTRVLFILLILLNLLGNMFPFKNSIFSIKNDWNPGFVHFVRFVDLVGGARMNNTRVLFILFILFILLILFVNIGGRGPARPCNVPKKNEQNEQNPGFVHFCLPPKSTKQTKWTKPWL